jgi:hypothetical protein
LWESKFGHKRDEEDNSIFNLNDFVSWKSLDM